MHYPGDTTNNNTYRGYCKKVDAWFSKSIECKKYTAKKQKETCPIAISMNSLVCCAINGRNFTKYKRDDI